MATNQVAQITPLVQKVAVDVDTVRFGKILRDQLSDSGEVRRLFLRAIVDVPEGLGRFRWNMFIGSS